MDRVNFIHSVSGINYPEMIVNFFDHFIALKQLVEDTGTVSVLNSDEKSILFSITFHTEFDRDQVIQMINSLGGFILIYGRNININLSIIDSTTIQIYLT